jgi:hypothetical protein
MASARPVLFRLLRTLAPLLLLVLLARPAAATSYVMVEDGDLADQAAVIAEVQVDSSQPAPARRSAGTDYLVDVLRTVKGSPAGSSIVVRVPGGRRPDGMSLKIWGAPELRDGDRALLFLVENEDGTYGILHLLLGAFHTAEAGGRKIALRNLSAATEVHRRADGSLTSSTREDRPRDLDRFAAWLADRAQGVSRKADYFVTLEKSALSRLTAKFTLFSNESSYLRWFDFDSGGSVAWTANEGGQGGVPGGGFTEIQNGLAAWNADPLTPIRYVWAGTTSATAGMKSFDDINSVLFGDPNKEISGTFDCSRGGVLAIGGPWFSQSGTSRFNGENFFVIGGGDIITNDGIDCFFTRSGGHSGKDFEEMVTHELGHTLGLQHSCGDSTSPSCGSDANKNDAIMRANIHGDGRGARIGVDDLAGTRRLYAEKDALAGCRASDRALCLAGRRFRVELSWVNQFDGSTGIGRAISATDVSGYFSFGDPSNIELLVKVLNFGGGTFKVFFGELTNLKFILTVTDTQTGQFKTYGNTTGDCGGIDQDFFANAAVDGWSTAPGSAVLPDTARASGSCRPGRGVLCLLDGRFAVQVDWQNPFDGSTGQGGPSQLSNFVGTFFFTDPSNVELMTKVIPFPDRVVFFYGALSDFKYNLQVTDTVSGRVNVYSSRPAQLCGGLDNNAF